jgi:hypothetical protein
VLELLEISNTLLTGGIFSTLVWVTSFLGLIYGKIPSIMPKWSDMPKVFLYHCTGECYAESFCTINS